MTGLRKFTVTRRGSAPKEIDAYDLTVLPNGYQFTVPMDSRQLASRARTGVVIVLPASDDVIEHLADGTDRRW